MAKHTILFEDLIKASHQNTERLIELHFKDLNDNISDEDIIRELCEIFDNLKSMTTVIDHNIKCAKKAPKK